MTRIIVAGILVILGTPALAAVSTTTIAPKVTLPTISGGVVVKQATPVPPPTSTTQPGKILPPPAITGVKPVECVKKNGTIYLQGLNLLSANGNSIALDDGSGTHIDLTINSWTATSISTTVPNDPRVVEGAGYWVAMEKSDHSMWLSNVDKSITICNSSLSEPGSTSSGMPVAIPGNASLLGGELPPPPAAKSFREVAIKEDVTVEPGELVVVSATMKAAQQLQKTAQSMGLAIKRRTPLNNLGLVVSVLRVPKGMAVADALDQLRHALPNEWIDANHRYQLQTGTEVSYAKRAIAWKQSAGCGAGYRIGLIDTDIDATHPLFKGRAIISRSFLPAGVAAAPRVHGTATASILVGAAPSGLMPHMRLHAAAIFRASNNQEVDTTAELVVSALDWLVGQKVTVINLSLGGTRNLMLEAAVERVMQRGIIVVAAAGNGGDEGEPVYPAAQPGVIAVTAVDVNFKPYKNASQGEYIAYAAPGVDVWVAVPGGGGVYATGTSYAVPFVTAVIAAAKWSGRANNRAALDKLLQSSAKDLGAAGRDNVFGWGLIQLPGNCVRSAKKSAGKRQQR